MTKPWWHLRREKLVAEETLIADFYLPRKQLGHEYLHTYYEPTRPIRTIKEDTLFWYEAGRFPSSTIYPVEIDPHGRQLTGADPISERDFVEAEKVADLGDAEQAGACA
jgi:hypothetical protein